MPPKRARPSTRGSAKKKAPAQQTPPSSEDAKPNVDQLNAEVQAEAQAELHSDPPLLPSDSQPKYPPEPVLETQADLPSESAPEPAADDPAAEPSTTAAPLARRLDSLGPSGSRGKKPVAAPRFAGRRSQAKRDELEKAKEEEKRREDEVKKAAESSRSSRSETARGRGRGRGRGGHGREDRRVEPVASGPFSAGQVSKETQQLNKRWSSRGSGWKGWRVGPESRSGKKTTKGKGSKDADGDVKPQLDANGDVSMDEVDDKRDYASSDDEEVEGQRRMNVEKLGIIDLTKDDSGINPFAPIRIARVPHKERRFGVRDDSAVKEDAAVKVDVDMDDNEPTTATNANEKSKVTAINSAKTFQGVYSDSESDSKPRIKSETTVEDGQADGTSQSKPDAPSSPETKQKGKGRAKPKAVGTASLDEYDEETEMDRIEEERHWKDLEFIQAELGQPEKDGDAVMSGTNGSERRAEKVYLLQFPPTLPDFEQIVVKPDPDALNGDSGDIMQVDAPTNQAKPITINDTAEQFRLPSGAVGKMMVHASGKVTLDWGGMSLRLGVGGKADFLQSIVAAEIPDQKKGAAAAADMETGNAINLGHVKEKFVVTPDWDELLG